MGQRNSTAEKVIDAAKEGDRQKLLDLALLEMQGREAGADALIADAKKLDPATSKVEYQEHHGAPDNYIVTATDSQGHEVSFELDWSEARWQVALGTAGPAKSPAASTSP
ncbi:hypothetical protein NMQ03_19630 [Arthrobacter sp. DNA4]|nr:hypothetical protein [Arthrobacter sp. DNA4]UTT69368.1 hypothetical protein NMQ03_19630 [Arthrobacter sp. DNA4]